MRQTAEALAAAHRAALVHRDVKPQNILLDAEGNVKLLDLGIAKDPGGAGDALTATGGALGTPAYMSPEQCRGARNLDGRSDLYSLGVTLFFLLSGEPPYGGDTAYEVLRQHIESPRPTRSACGRTCRPPSRRWCAASWRKAQRIGRRAPKRWCSRSTGSRRLRSRR